VRHGLSHATRHHEGGADAERAALLAEGESLVKAHDRLRLTPANSPAHAAHRERLRIHHGRVRSHFLHRRNRAADK
jgi:hypothetical protein